MKNFKLFLGAALLFYAGTIPGQIFHPENGVAGETMSKIQNFTSKNSPSTFRQTSSSPALQYPWSVKTSDARFASYGLPSLIGVAGVFFFLLRRRRLKIAAGKQNQLASTPVGINANAPCANRPRRERENEIVANQAYADVSRQLLADPFNFQHKDITFDQRVLIAAEASLRVGRKIGTIAFQLPKIRTSDIAMDQINESRLRSNVIVALKDKLREKDCVTYSSENEIVVFISFLKTKGDLNKIAARLFGVASAVVEKLSLDFDHAPGIAMYPLDGYDAEQLIKSACYRIEPIAPRTSSSIASKGETQLVMDAPVSKPDSGLHLNS